MAFQRTVGCGDVRADRGGQEVVLNGWVQRTRDHGGLIFIDLRDRSGLVQVVVNPATHPDAHRVAGASRSEFVLAVRGAVSRRPAGTENLGLPTGEVEVQASAIEILNPSKTPPFPIVDDLDADEGVRLKYRYLDLRRPVMLRRLELRHRVIKFMRDFLSERGFLEVETPLLTKSTPEGARDYLVPCRVYPGEFYALPQSPQQYKQLLMVAGVEKYFQIARCLRDEDPRADRLPEFTQLDLEMSFVTQDDVLGVVEELYTALVAALSDKQLVSPFPRLTYQEAMDRFGSDKPDLRYGLELVDLTDLVAGCGFRVFAQAAAGGGQVKAIRAPGCAGFTRSQVDEFTEIVKTAGGKGLVSIALTEEGIRSATPILKFLSQEEVDAILRRAEMAVGDLLFVVADAPKVVAGGLDRIRRELARRLNLLDPTRLMFAWVTDFPLFEWDEKTNRWDAVHHPFTAPKPEDVSLMATDPGRVRSDSYDLVCNGYEAAGGSIRIHQRDVQEMAFRALGLSDETVKERFGHLLEAFEYGAPPHGGIAPGIDRLLMLLLNEENIRGVVPFPKTASFRDSMMDAPSRVDEAQLQELHLRLAE